MSTLRAVRLARTFAIAGIISVISDHDFAFNGHDLLTLILAGTAAALLIHSKGN